MKVIAGIVGGFILACLGAMLVVTTFAASTETGSGLGAAAFFILWTVGIAVALYANTAAKAWRRLLISSGVLSFLAPLAGVIYTGSFMATHVDAESETAGAEAAGAAIGGGLISGAMGFVGFFLGVVFLIIGLLVGRDPKIVYAQNNAENGN